MSLLNNTYRFYVSNQSFKGYYNTSIIFNINNNSYSFDCALSEGKGTIYTTSTTGTLSTSPPPITTLTDGIYTINSGTYSVSITGITTESTSITFGDVTANTSGALSQTITIN
jgi:hypothetical protein